MILPNLPYLLWLARFSPTRALFNVDYIVLGILSVFLPPVMVVFAIFVLSIVDAFVFISSMFHFSPREMILSFGYARYNPLKISDVPWINLIGILLLTALTGYFALRVSKSRSKSVPVTLGSLLCLLVLCDVYNGTNTNVLLSKLPFYGRTQYMPINVGNSGVLAVDAASFLPGKRLAMQHVESASQIAFRQSRRLEASEVPNSNMALILVESWGKFDQNDGLTRSIAMPLLSPEMLSRYQVNFGSVSFHGSTTSAELRELCGLQGSYRDLFDLPRSRCLTDVYAEYGYTITGMHGFRGYMFDRVHWWPLIGLRKQVFLDTFERSGLLTKCGSAFPGLCDADLINALGDKLRAKKQFIYALTLNSHLPLPPANESDGSLNCLRLPSPLHDVRCALAQKWRLVFEAVARNALRSDIKPTQFVIVGDHSPPLMNVGDDDFSPSQVPFIILTPRHVVNGRARSGGAAS